MSYPPLMNQEKKNNYRTILCNHFAAGHCSFGPRCTFSHDLDAPVSRTHLVDRSYVVDAPNFSSNSMNDYYSDTSSIDPAQPTAAFYYPSKHPAYRTKECKYHQLGSCIHGDSCNFRHSGFASQDKTLSAMHPSPALTENPYWKTRLCAFYRQGVCLKESSCPYIHDPSERRPEVDAGINTRYSLAKPVLSSPALSNPSTNSRSSQPCKYYFGTGCAYGDMCVWSHADPPQLARATVNPAYDSYTIQSRSLERAGHHDDEEDRTMYSSSVSSSPTSTTPSADGRLGEKDASDLHASSWPKHVIQEDEEGAGEGILLVIREEVTAKDARPVDDLKMRLLEDALKSVDISRSNEEGDDDDEVVLYSPGKQAIYYTHKGLSG